MKAADRKAYITTAMLGFAPGDAPNPHLSSSNMARAFAIGRWLRDTGRAAPSDLAPSRGHTWRVRDMRIIFDHAEQIERIS